MDEDLFCQGSETFAEEDLEFIQHWNVSLEPEELVMHFPEISSPSYSSTNSICSSASQNAAELMSSQAHLGAFTPYGLCGTSSVSQIKMESGVEKCSRKKMWRRTMELLVEENRSKNQVPVASATTTRMDAESSAPEQQPVFCRQLHPANLIIQQQQQLDSSPTPSPMDIKSMAANYNHKIAERNRRSREKELKEQLMKLIPHKFLKKKDKNTVLQGSINYIKELLLKVQIAERQQQTISEALPPVEFCNSPNPMDEEVINKSTADSPPNSLMIQEDGDIFKVCLNTSSVSTIGNKVLIDLMDALQNTGLKIDSLVWKPETSPILALTAHSLMGSNPVSGSQLREVLEHKLFPQKSPSLDA